MSWKENYQSSIKTISLILNSSQKENQTLGIFSKGIGNKAEKKKSLHGTHLTCYAQFWPPHHKGNTVEQEKDSKKGHLKDKQEYVITSVQMQTEQTETLSLGKKGDLGG